MEKISVVIITYNEERNIKRCLDSVKTVADEIVIVDSFSNDRTEEICRSFDVKFIKQKFLGYIEQKNFALDFANNDYVLSLDADEALSKDLIKSITNIKNEGIQFQGYTMNRCTNYCGKWIYHGGWYPDRKLRLFNRKLGKWGGINPHDEFLFHQKTPKVSHLKGDLLHYSYYTINDHLKQIEHFTNISSQTLYEKGKKPNSGKMIFSPISRFIKDYLIKGGFLDGKEGFTISLLSAKASYIKYSKLKKLYLKNA